MQKSQRQQDKIMEGEHHLIKLDKDIKIFAKKNRMKITKNYHEWPERTFTWKNSGLKRMIQLHLEDEKEKNFLIWGCAYKDRLMKRFWLKLEPEQVAVPLVWNKIEKIVKRYKESLDRVKESDLMLS